MDREQLLNLIKNSENKLECLKAIDYEGLAEKTTELESIFKEFKEGGTELLREDNTLQIGIVGQVKAGKSSFLNSLFFNGSSVLPKASTPMTAGLTIMEYAEKNTFEVEYFNEKDWEIFVNQDEEYRRREQEVRQQNPDAPESVIRKEIESRTSERIRSAHEMVSACSTKARDKVGCKNDVKDFFDNEELQNVLEQYVGANGEYTSVVKSLYIKMNDERLKGLRIVDTPGVNDPVVSRENRTRTFLHSCHGVFLLSASTDFLGCGDVNFLNTRIGGSGIGSVVLLASKFDSVLQDIGADREMKKEERGDLADTVEMQTKKFKRRLRELSETIDEKLRGRIKLDTTSGIGFSIANKPSSKWDDIEKKVVQQMKRYYPDYFETENDIKESFEGLSNISEIRDNYLYGVFMSNKESIMAEKVKDFFAKNKIEISATIKRILEEFQTRQVELNETTIAEIQKQKEIQSELFDNLKGTFADVFNQFSINIQITIKTISNNLRFNGIFTIPTEKATENITYKGAWWGHNTETMEIDQVNTHELGNQIRNAVEGYVTSWNQEWIKLFDTVRKEMKEKLISAINDFELKIMSTSFKDTYYRNLIDRALGELKNNQELSIDNLKEKYLRQGEDIANDGRFSPTGTDELKEEAISSFLSRKLHEHNKQLITKCRNLADGLKEEVRLEINKNLKGAIEIIDKMKTSFAENLKKEGEVYLKGLEKDMEEKSVVLKKMETIINNINELYALYK